MKANRSIPTSTVLPVLVYPDVQAASDWVVSAFGFVRSALAGSFGVSAYPRLAAFCDRADDLEPFRRAPALDGVTAPID